ncbi:MAG TPA: hypothetical protein VJN18_10745 [Polyangiaceae bacterium]|nr:hypothetical protein [Polyangiaceae bacterium]
MTKLSKLALLTLLASGAFACTVERTQTVTSGYYFTGWVYDGVTNERLEEYELFVTQGEGTLTASMSDPGRYWVGPVEPFHDYTVTIDGGSDYRPFYASQRFLTGSPPAADGMQSQLFEAFLFPSPDVLPSPALTFTIQTPDGTEPNGQLRVTPANDVGESVLNLDGDIDGSVAGQVWDNDADRKFETVTREVVDGVVTFEEGDLVYGVEYEATVFAAEGFSLQSFTFRSGVAGDQTVVLPRLTEQPLAITSSSLNTDDDGLDENATIVLTFNQDIEASARFTLESVDEALDESFSIVSPDADMDGNQNTLAPDDDDTVQERGARWAIDANMLTLSWDRAGANFAVFDAQDPIAAATYDISSIRLKPVGARVEREVQLSALLNSATITTQIDPIAY